MDPSWFFNLFVFLASSDGNFIFCGKADFWVAERTEILLSALPNPLNSLDSSRKMGILLTCPPEEQRVTSSVPSVTCGLSLSLCGHGWDSHGAIPWDQGCWECSDPHRGPASPALFGDRLVPERILKLSGEGLGLRNPRNCLEGFWEWGHERKFPKGILKTAWRASGSRDMREASFPGMDSLKES